MSVYGSGNMRGQWEPQVLKEADLPPVPPPLPEPEKPASGSGAQRKRRGDLFGGLLPGGLLPDGIDSYTLLIAALLFLLLKEGGDIRLVIALGYILL